MLSLDNISRIYFIGIGGIGMSAIARYFNAKGTHVSGYDKTATTLTKKMESENINIHYVDSVSSLDKKAQLVVYTPAIPADHEEMIWYKQNNFTIVKRSDVLEKITENSFNICIAGTHGKTTISTMIAHILHDSGYGCTAFLGGIAVNYNSNFWSDNNNVCVVEADEYDRSFLKLKPDIAVISAMDADHLDIYGTEDALHEAFIDFSNKLKPEGILFTKFGLSKAGHFTAKNQIRYSLQNDSADAFAANFKIKHGGYQFTVSTKDWMIDNVMLPMGGMHNVENAVAAITIAHKLGIENEKIRKAITTFKGIKRRFEYIVNSSSFEEKDTNAGIVFIDDYAHHPEELKALISGAKSLFSGMKCTIIFQPHLYSRTRDLAKDFAHSLDIADEIVLLPIYPARELPVEGVSSKMILDEMKNKNKSIKTKEEVLKYIKEVQANDAENIQPVLFITAGAGDIDTLVEPLKNILTLKSHPQNFA